eukprot:TRINITY_DN4152_c0_g1_i2.p1 TRINITY_DN4152_c0_g1~~TRINITY_DN4152_c0_g1_i2.p1  ORF type:complete len:495 (-),score=68.92 TRINITY_DN4152_c0_g1_i2:76-1560(-)
MSLAVSSTSWRMLAGSDDTRCAAVSTGGMVTKASGTQRATCWPSWQRCTKRCGAATQRRWSLRPCWSGSASCSYGTAVACHRWPGSPGRPAQTRGDGLPAWSKTSWRSARRLARHRQSWRLGRQGTRRLHGNSRWTRLDAALETAEADVHGLADAVVACRSRTDHMHEEQRQLLTSAEERLSEVLSASLEFATKGLNPTNLWVTWMRLFRLIQRAVDTGYEHLPALETAKSVAQELGLSLDYTMDIRKVGRAEPKVIEHFQRVFDATRHSEFMGQGPLKVQKVIEVHHESTRAEYLLKRKLLVEDCDSGPEVEAIHVKSQEFSWADALDLEHEPVDSRYNEFYLFHGTSPEIVEAITDTDFLIQRAPAHGHTFGRGVYLSEYVTHAQFFASEVCGGFSSGSIAILVCRAFCGRINDVGLWENTAQRHGKADEFERLLEDGTYHCTMGAEWPRWAECREFILADDDQVLPEFIVICTAEEKPDVDAEFVMVEGGT